MYITLRKFQPIVKNMFGKQVWMEQSQLKIPKGGKKIDYGFKFFGGFFGFCAVLGYAYFQSQQNPDSIYKRCFAYLADFTKSLEGPAEDKLRPDAVKPPL